MRHASNAPVRMLASLLAIAALGFAASPSQAQTGPETDLADWVTVDGPANVATGTLRGASVSLTGTDVGPGSVTDGSFSGFATANFSPSVPVSDAIGLFVANGSSFTLTFGAPLKDPVLHLASFGSTFDFPAGTVISKISGQPGLTVSGSSVMGAEGPGSGQASDANGTVQLTGTFSSLAFTANPIPTAPNGDGLYLQVGARVPATPPAPAAPAPPPAAQVPPPAAPATSSVERSVTPPAIVKLRGLNRRYQCVDGTWESLAADPAFAYTWWRAGTVGSLLGDGRTSLDREVATGNVFSLPSRDEGLRFYCQVRARAESGRVLTATSATTVLGGAERPVTVVSRAYGNFRIRGIDVFQVVQPNAGAEMFGYPTGAFPIVCGGGTPTSFTCGPNPPAMPNRARYAGVAMDQRKPTTAAVYVDMDGTPATDSAQALDVTLRARLDGRLLSGAITRRKINPKVSTTGWVTAAERADARNTVSFELPSAWLASAVLSRDRLDLEASVRLPVGAGSGTLQECRLQVLVAGATGCRRDNDFTLEDLPVSDELPDLTIKSIRLVQRGQSPDSFASPESVMALAAQWYPGGDRWTVQPYSADVDITTAANLNAPCEPYRAGGDLRGCRAAAVEAALDDWHRLSPNNRTGYNLLLATHQYLTGEDGNGDGIINDFEPGFQRAGPTLESDPNTTPTFTVNAGNAGRVSTPAHEFGHALGFPHSDTAALGGIFGATAPGCGGDGEAWPQDFQGRLQGTALVERRPTLRGVTRTPVRVDGLGDTVLYDLMSYCDTTGVGRWMSARNWNRAFKVLSDVSLARRSALRNAAATVQSAQAGAGYVTGIIGPEGPRILRVTTPDAGNLAPEPDPSSPLLVRALGPGGQLLGEVRAQVRMFLDQGTSGTFAASLPAGASAVELVSGGQVVDRRERSRPPAVRVLDPRRGARAVRTLLVRWTASDPDADSLEATIEYSPNGRAGWRTLYRGPSRGRATISGRLLEASAAARVRVGVSDGFNHARAQSASFRADGAPPRVRIIAPTRGQELDAGTVVLGGSALDDRRRRLPGRALTWSAGGRQLGSGERLRARLPGGTVVVRLRARDRLGRTATAVTRLRVRPQALRVTTLIAPERVRAGARSITVRVATTVPGNLRAGGRSHRVGARTRTLRIGLPALPRRGVLKVPLAITALGARQPALRETIIVVRR